MIDSKTTVHMLWVEGSFSKLEKICANSFVFHGHEIIIWSYGGMNNAPVGSEVRDANEVLPFSLVFRGRSGSYAQFSDLFRYAVLSKFGGLWADTDVVCLSAARFGNTPFLVTERDRTPFAKRLAKKFLRRPDGKTINSNVIYNPRPKDGNIIHLAFQYAQEFPKENIVWGELGPRLLSAIEGIYPGHEFEIKPPNFSNAIDWWNCPSKLLESGCSLPSDALFLHLYNETWRRAGIDKNDRYPAGSIMKNMEDQFLY
jgi:hypothetical protein